MSFDQFFTAAGAGLDAFRRALASPPAGDENALPIDERFARRARIIAERTTASVQRKIDAEPGGALILAAGIGLFAGLYLARRSARSRQAELAAALRRDDAARDERTGDGRMAR